MHHSLVFFTVICQTAIGSLIFNEIFNFKTRDNSFHIHDRRARTFITGLLLFSIVIAFPHLGNPVNSINALNNLGSSWLSREIFFLSILAIFLILRLLINRYIVNILPARLLAGVISIVIALLILYSMIRLYMIPYVPSWNNPCTPIGFIMTTLSCGLAFFSSLSNFTDKYFKIILPALAFLVVAATINSIVYNSLSFSPLPFLFILRIVLALTSLILIAVKYFSAHSNKSNSFPVVLFIMITSSEVINRYIFFLSFEKSGL